MSESRSELCPHVRVVERNGSGTERKGSTSTAVRVAVQPVPSRASAHTREAPDRCGACGRFLRKDSYYSNRCSDCWTPEDEFIF